MNTKSDYSWIVGKIEL